MNLQDESDALHVLASLIEQITLDPDHSSPLQERMLQTKMRTQLPSLFELMQLMEGDRQPIEQSAAAELRVELCQAIECRLKTLRKLLLSTEERNMLELMDQNEIMDDRLHLIDRQLTELEQLHDRETKLVHEMRPLLNEFMNTFEFLLIDHGLKFRIEHDKKTIEKMILRAQSLLMQCRYRDTKKAFEKYGNKETVNELRRKREQLENRNKLLKMRLKEATDNKQKMSQLDSKLRQQLIALDTELKGKKWALSIGSKDSN